MFAKDYLTKVEVDLIFSATLRQKFALLSIDNETAWIQEAGGVKSREHGKHCYF